MRLFVKTMSYGFTHIVVATAVAYALTDDLMVALGIGLIEPIVQTFVFAIHDHIWEGKRPTKDKAVELVLHSY